MIQNTFSDYLLGDLSSPLENETQNLQEREKLSEKVQILKGSAKDKSHVCNVGVTNN